MRRVPDGLRTGQIAAALAALAVAMLVAACGGSSSGKNVSHAHRATRASLDGPTLSTPQREPSLQLHDSLGREVNLAGYRGRAVLVTFIYTHCPDTCPLIVANLHNALAQLGHQARKVQIVAVSTDPRGDTPAAVRRFLAKHAMTGRMEYLLGTRQSLAPVWRQWGISASAPTAKDRVGHSALIYGITGSGEVTTIYPSNFKPSTIAHDVPILAAL
jgi:protein SCO1/2